MQKNQKQPENIKNWDSEVFALSLPGFQAAFLGGLSLS